MTPTNPSLILIWKGRERRLLEYFSKYKYLTSPKDIIRVDIRDASINKFSKRFPM